VTVSALRALNDPFWVSWGFISASRREESERGCWRQNGLLDRATSSPSGTWLSTSMQTITTLGYTGVRPGQLLTEWIACAQAMIGIVFVAIFIGRWVNTT
jgi:hypothetical protein